MIHISNLDQSKKLLPSYRIVFFREDGYRTYQFVLPAWLIISGAVLLLLACIWFCVATLLTTMGWTTYQDTVSHQQDLARQLVAYQVKYESLYDRIYQEPKTRRLVAAAASKKPVLNSPALPKKDPVKKLVKPVERPAQRVVAQAPQPPAAKSPQPPVAVKPSIPPKEAVQLAKTSEKAAPTAGTMALSAKLVEKKTDQASVEVDKPELITFSEGQAVRLSFTLKNLLKPQLQTGYYAAVAYYTSEFGERRSLSQPANFVSNDDKSWSNPQETGFSYRIRYFSVKNLDFRIPENERGNFSEVVLYLSNKTGETKVYRLPVVAKAK